MSDLTQDPSTTLRCLILRGCFLTKLRRAWAQHPANLIKKSRRHLPRSAFGQAIDYALSNWPLLGVYLEDGRLELDNNLVENAIRP